MILRMIARWFGRFAASRFETMADAFEASVPDIEYPPGSLGAERLDFARRARSVARELREVAR